MCSKSSLLLYDLKESVILLFRVLTKELARMFPYWSSKLEHRRPLSLYTCAFSGHDHRIFQHDSGMSKEYKIVALKSYFGSDLVSMGYVKNVMSEKYYAHEFSP